MSFVNADVKHSQGGLINRTVLLSCFALSCTKRQTTHAIMSSSMIACTVVGSLQWMTL